MIGLNLYKNVKPCKRCNELIRQYPCAYCEFKPQKPKNPKISEGYHW